MHPKKTITIAVLAVAVFFLYYSANAAPLIDDGNFTYIAGLEWHNNFDAGLAAAQAENKPIFMYSWAIWCKFCKELHETVYPDPAVQSILKEDFVLVAVDLDVNQKDAQRFGVQYPPNLQFFTPAGEKITEIPGYIPKDDFIPILEQIRSQHALTVEVPQDLPRTEEREES